MGKDKLFYRFSLCIFLQFLQQMCGSNLISTYSTVRPSLNSSLPKVISNEIRSSSSKA
jgi:hypothetical protein